MSRTKRAIRRKNNFKKARRKSDIAHWNNVQPFENLHQYSKDNTHRKHDDVQIRQLTAVDIRQLENFKEQEIEYYEGVG